MTAPDRSPAAPAVDADSGQWRLRRARAEASAAADMLELVSAERPYLRQHERARILAALRDLASLAGTAVCDADTAWIEGYCAREAEEQSPATSENPATERLEK